MRVANPLARFGEDQASSYLQKHGYKIIERNYRKTYGEIDIIAIDESLPEKVLAFVEVKTRTSNAFGSPFEAIGYWKLRSLIKTAQYYKMTHRNLPESLRIDAIAVTLIGEEVQNIELTKNISGF